MYGYLLDMDGVIYRGGELIPGADRFIAHLQERGIPFMFLTNNSQRTRRDDLPRFAFGPDQVRNSVVDIRHDELVESFEAADRRERQAMQPQEAPAFSKLVLSAAD